MLEFFCIFASFFASMADVNLLSCVQPYGFDVGQSERGTVLKGLDLGVEGMRVGGQVIVISLSAPDACHKEARKS